jgi:hypothetical protein
MYSSGEEMEQTPLPPEMEKLLRQLRRGGLAFTRLDAVQKIAKLKTSHPQLVLGLMRAAASDQSAQVRRAAADALKARVHAEVAARNPGLAGEAQQPEEEILQPSVVGAVSFGLSILSILLVYADVFLVTGPAPSAGGLPIIDISPLFCLSFLLSLAGVVLGIIGLRQEDRNRMLPRLGLLFNGLIVIGSLFLTMVIRFTIA